MLEISSKEITESSDIYMAWKKEKIIEKKKKRREGTLKETNNFGDQSNTVTVRVSSTKSLQWCLGQHGGSQICHIQITEA